MLHLVAEVVHVTDDLGLNGPGHWCYYTSFGTTRQLLFGMRLSSAEQRMLNGPSIYDMQSHC